MLEKIKKLKPINFRYKINDSELHYGLIAQELAEIFPDLVVKNPAEDFYRVKYIELIPILIKGIQELTKRIEKLEEK